MTNLAAQIETATNDNEHTVALIIKAKAMNNETGNAFATILQEIEDEHILDGELSPLNNMLRRSIDMKLRQYNEFLGLAPQPIFTV
jgi:hypothetical protein